MGPESPRQRGHSSERSYPLLPQVGARTHRASEQATALAVPSNIRTSNILSNRQSHFVRSGTKRSRVEWRAPPVEGPVERRQCAGRSQAWQARTQVGSTPPQPNCLHSGIEPSCYFLRFTPGAILERPSCFLSALMASRRYSVAACNCSRVASPENAATSSSKAARTGLFNEPDPI
jgi:hypothetical protein